VLDIWLLHSKETPLAEFKNKYPDSPKGRIYTAFKSGGADAARAMADKLANEKVEGAAKAPGKVDKWLKDWGAADDTPSPEKPVSKAPAKTPKVPVKKPPGRRVYDKSEPNVHGTVITEGEQVSTIRWDVPTPWGKESHVSNEHLEDAKDEPPRQDRHTFLNAHSFRVMRKDKELGTYKTFKTASEAADDGDLWVFARTKGGSVALLQRPHWGQYRRLEEAKSEAA
jgi:hypothetical protein